LPRPARPILPLPHNPQVMNISRMMEAGGFRAAGASLSGLGGIDSGADAAEFILLGSDTVQVSATKAER
jgi:dihydroorotate dehydrogenase